MRLLKRVGLQLWIVLLVTVALTGAQVIPMGFPAIAAAAALTGKVALEGGGDVVIVVSGRNVDEARFTEWIAAD